jgi:glucokinase
MASLKPGNAVDKQTIALVAPGTGLGQALLVWIKDRYVPVSSEGGHADFAPTTDQEASLWRHLHEKLGHVSIEEVASGQGLVNIYAWLKASGNRAEPEWLKERMQTSDPAAVIAQAGLENKDPHCVEALDRFVSILGSVAGNLALIGLARGGVYLGGGIPPKILPKLKGSAFQRSFVNKGRFETFLDKIPVHVILNDKAPLLGAAGYAVRLVE